MPISEKEVSTNTSGSVGINIYSLGSETKIFSLFIEPKPSLCHVKINLRKNFFSVYKKHLPAHFLLGILTDHKLSQTWKSSRNTQIKFDFPLITTSKPSRTYALRRSPSVRMSPMPDKPRPSVSLTGPLWCVQNALFFFFQFFVIHLLIHSFCK